MQYILPSKIYYEELESVMDIDFTLREVDIISCILNGKSTKKIALLLFISPKTVENHIRNIMFKLNCNCREMIIDFIENSNKDSIFRRYYLSLITYSNFEHQLKKILENNFKKTPLHITIYFYNKVDKFCYAQQLAKHLKIVGYEVRIEFRDEDQFPDFNYKHINDNQNSYYNIYIVPEKIKQSLIINKHKNIMNVFSIPKGFEENIKFIFLFFMQEDDIIALENLRLERINLFNLKNYYLSFFDLLEEFCPNVISEKSILKINYQSFNTLYIEENTPSSNKDKNILLHKITNINNFINCYKLKKVFTFLFVIVCMVIAYVIIGGSLKYDHITPIRSDLAMPARDIIIKRHKLITQIENEFNEKSEIKAVALAGFGGSGKTTIARLYGITHNFSIIWEINAETKESIIRSFENLAYSLSKTKEEREILEGLHDLTNENEKNNRLFSFIKQKLKSFSNWLLIYDNVKNFSEIHKYFPYNYQVWGQGRIIITTCDRNIQNNNYINKVIIVGELSDKEKFDLFIKIVNSEDKKKLTESQKIKIKEFLKKLPPFPLDISVAANYINATSLSYEKYIKCVETHSAEFEEIQSNIMNNYCGYKETRHSIIILSLRKLLESSKDWVELLLLISLLNSQDIPLDLLYQYKNINLDNFIYHLKKYSLIENNDCYFSTCSSSSVSIHRSTQEIILHYLIEVLNQDEKNKAIKSISNIFSNYIHNLIESENFSPLTALMIHAETFLSHKEVITEDITSHIKGELAGIHLYLGNYIKSISLVEKSLAFLKEDDKNNLPIIATFLFYTGMNYWELGELSKAQSFLRKSFLIYNRCLCKEYEGIAHSLVYLGSVYSSAGKYNIAEKVLKKAYGIYKNFLPKNYNGVAICLLSLSSYYKKIGNYKKANSLLEYSLSLYKKYAPENRLRIARNLVYLGILARIQGDYEKSKERIHESLLIYKEYFPSNQSDIAWASAHLGNVYYQLNIYKGAKKLLKQSLKIYRQQLLGNHPRVARIIMYLGKVYTATGNYKKAKKYLRLSFKHYNKIYHKENIKTARLLINLGVVYFIEGEIETAKNIINKALNIFLTYKGKALKEQVIGCLKQALNVIRSRPDLQKITERIQSNINYIISNNPKTPYQKVSDKIAVKPK